VDKNGDLVLTTNATASVGTESVFDASANSLLTKVAFDNNSNRILVVYCDDDDSDKGKAVVGTVASDGTISYGTPAIFNNSATKEYFGINVVFDSNVNKFLIVYGDGATGGPGKAVVATVDSSDNSVTFGTAATFESGNSDYISAAFDSTANKIVIAYRDTDDSNYGKAIVGTISGTDVTFGSAATFESANSQHINIAYDSTNNKSLIAYKDTGNSNYGTCIVGTVSGTSISFGTAAVFNSGNSIYINNAFHSSSGKVAITYEDQANSSKGTAILATISGTSVSVGSEVVFNAGTTYTSAPVDDPDTEKLIIVFRDNGNSNYTTAVEGTVSGTSISFGSETVIYSAFGFYADATYDTNVNKVVAVYAGGGDGYRGASNTYTVSQDLSGSLSHDAVTAGTALSATKLLVKG
jgi:hypothetical protein